VSASRPTAGAGVRRRRRRQLPDDQPGACHRRPSDIAAAEVGSAAELDAALAAALERPGATLIRVAVDPRVDNQPMMPAGTDYGRLHGHCVARPGEPFSDGAAESIRG